ncbi:MAG: protein translocase subunit SecDF [Bacteroidales bacterium]
MQNKGFVRVFAILLTLVCIFYLSFSAVTSYYNKKAVEYAGGDVLKQNYYLDSISSEKVWLSYTFKEAREMQVGLGLDLKGGMNVILEISVADVLKSLSDNNPDENFNKALAAATKRQNTSNQDYMTLFMEEFKKLDPNARLSAIFSTFQLKDKINPNSTNEEVLRVLKQESDDAISNSFNVLRTRIDRFGVVAPNIQKLDKDGRILVELPGVKEPARVRKLLQGSANLEFWETYELTEIYQNLVAANQVIAAQQKALAPAEEAKTDAEATQLVNEEDSIVTSTDSLANEIAAIKGADEALQDQKAFEKEYPLFAKLSINQYNGQIAPGSVVGYAAYPDTAAINAMLNMKQVRDLLPRNLQLRWSVKAVDEKEQFYQLYALKQTGRNGRPALEGDVIVDAREDFQQNTNAFEISMSMNAEGAKVWARLTKENIGKQVAIVLDDVVYSAPRVNSEITGGRSSITGDFSAEEAKDLANVLKSGKMAAKVRIVQEDVVGPSLGKEAISNGLISFVVALVLLFTYMMAIYGLVPGMIANLALIMNLFFTMGILSSFHAVLTLSGIAGLVLSLGVAVDANVLIYERAKEELRSGKNIKKAVADAYSNAFSAIFDANVTSLITGIILFMFGTGPIKGFATTLMIGIVTSFFTAVFLSRLILERGLEKGWFSNITFTTGLSKNILVKPNFDFLGNRKKGYIFSGVMILICIASFFIRGLNQGIEFTGGRNYIVRFDEPVKTGEIRNSLEGAFSGSSLSVITIGGDNQVRISTNYKVADDSENVDNEIINLIYKGVQNELPQGTTETQFAENNIMSFQKVGPAIADDIKTSAIWAVLFAMLAMGAYILIRFRDIAFSVGTIASVVHDTIIIIGVYSLAWGLLPFSMEIDQAFIAAILTVIGYSVNDTVVIFDRIREVTGIYPNRDKKEVDNEALNSTLARTFSTSLSTAIVLLCIFVLGGDTIRSFTFAMLVGVVLGTYSTLFIAVPFAYELVSKKKAKLAASK